MEDVEFLGVEITRNRREEEEKKGYMYELSPSVESVPRRRCPTRVPNMSSREGGASGSFDALGIGYRWISVFLPDSKQIDGVTYASRR